LLFRIATATQTIATSLTPVTTTAILKAIVVMAATPTAEGSTAPMETAGSSLITEMALLAHRQISLATTKMVPMSQLEDTRSLQVTLEETHAGVVTGDQMPPEEEMVIDLILKGVGTTTMEINRAEAE